MTPRPILHELGFLATFMGWLAFALYAAPPALGFAARACGLL